MLGIHAADWTLPAATVDYTKTTSTTSTITLVWKAGSASTRSYNIYGKQEAGSRDLSSAFTLLTNTRCTYTSAEPGTF